MSSARPPLYVDLDGTLIATDSLWEALVSIARRNPRELIGLLPLVFQKARFKAAVGDLSTLTPSDLPYRQELLDYLAHEHKQGRRLILATASHEKIAKPIAAYLGFFDDVLATHATRNLRGTVKRDAIIAHAAGPFEYIGDQAVDLPIWQAAQTAHAVLRTGKGWDTRVPTSQRGRIFEASGGNLRDLVQAMRPWQWSKNTLLFLPALLSHTFLQPHKLALAIGAFASFSLSASAIYLVNDIFDVQADRHHPKKRLRPFALGTLSIPSGLLAASFLGLASLVLASVVSWTFVLIILGYILTTCLYTLWLKTVPMIDVLLIGFFYTYRIIAGGIATNVPITDWLLAFSTFFFLSIGIIKRYGELLLIDANGLVASKNNRGYEARDIPLLLGFGLNSAFLSVVIFALYLHSSDVTKLYQHPTLLWGIVFALLVWLMRLWFLVQRGAVQDDPLLFTLRDRMSAFLMAFVAALLILAT